MAGALQVQELALHPAYEGVPQERWDRLVAAYARRRDDPSLWLRVRTYRIVMLVWWLVRWARYLVEVPRGLDTRLVSRPAGWLEGGERQYDRYLAKALIARSSHDKMNVS